MDHVHQFSDHPPGGGRKGWLTIPRGTRLHNQMRGYVRRLTRITLAVAVCACVAGTLASRVAARPVTDKSVLDADRDLIQALGKTDKAAVDGLLDAEFTWIDASGKNLTRGQVLENVPEPANADVEGQERRYGQAAIVRANRGKMQVLRIWVKRDAGWRVLLYQEVKQVEKSEPPAAGRTEISECQNPCKSIPFQPETPSEKEAIASWQGVMRAMADSNAEAYAPLIAEEFTATDTHHDAPYSKADRLAQLQKQKQAGAKSVPPALVSARMFDFGETVMMIAREQRPKARAYFNTRMWVRRDGRWQMLFSFNTRIESAS